MKGKLRKKTLLPLKVKKLHIEQKVSFAVSWYNLICALCQMCHFVENIPRNQIRKGLMGISCQLLGG